MIQGYPIPSNWREEFERAKAKKLEGVGDGAPVKKIGPETHVKMPNTASGKPRFASRSDGVEAGIVSGGFVPPTLDN